jgi:hypothetical protein
MDTLSFTQKKTQQEDVGGIFMLYYEFTEAEESVLTSVRIGKHKW